MNSYICVIILKSRFFLFILLLYSCRCGGRPYFDSCGNADSFVHWLSGVCDPCKEEALL